jgi:RNA recognition motif-containing protein
VKPGEEKGMSKKLFVGNLSFKVDEEGLKEVFSKIGEVLSVKIITDNVTGRSRGFGFVEMSSAEDAEKAIATLNGSSLLDRNITVSEARPQRERGGFRGSEKGGRKSGNW